MKSSKGLITMFALFSSMFFLMGIPQGLAFEVLKGDMSNYDPGNPTFPTSGDTIKVGVYWMFSGPLAINGHIAWSTIGFAVHDINSQGGIMVDGKMKKIQMFKGDNQGDPNTGKRAMEKLCLEDKVDFIIGTTGTHLSLIAQQMAGKYKKIYLNVAALSDLLMDGKNFNRYTFRAAVTTDVLGRALAYYFKNRPEKKFYILCQDYAYGRAYADGFKNGFKEYLPGRQMVGEDYHPLAAKDFAPYLTKAQGSGAEVIVTGDYAPDAGNLLKAKAQMGVKAIMGGNLFWEVSGLQALGGPGGAGNVAVSEWLIRKDNPIAYKYFETWNRQWKTWKEPYNTTTIRYSTSTIAIESISSYWFFDVVQRAKSTDPEKIIKVFEGDKWSGFGPTVEMRTCDHTMVQDLYGSELIFPNSYWEDAAFLKDNPDVIPAKYATAPIPTDLARCKK